MNSTENRFEKDTVYVSKKHTQAEVFEEVYLDLLAKELVTEDFLVHLLEREQQYPTGIDLAVVNPNFPNIAIPHTESEFVKTTRIIPIKLETEIEFKNMIFPDETLSVHFLFMILNGNGMEQTGLLADIMDFINSTAEQDLLAFFNMENTAEIYQFLEKHF
ncbi:PTS family fructose/mannitol porter component IIA [Listeria floridensis FSL S10-1187]|uniref:PTS family fructose/mannitol porter component IIA n=1 Tax=Listeria floridensis FSL S10-1187 TaxID=1265817 RepID=A0ABN0REM1_9LIST|nr:PTS sugar transporter subunit IIA [Listeria floridensis]EUJ31378.1 PTS family fructose/mannitol porter component IIA [Listeria floridensis FSL S10-1187]